MEDFFSTFFEPLRGGEASWPVKGPQGPRSGCTLALSDAQEEEGKGETPLEALL